MIRRWMVKLNKNPVKHSQVYSVKYYFSQDSNNAVRYYSFTFLLRYFHVRLAMCLLYKRVIIHIKNVNATLAYTYISYCPCLGIIDNIVYFCSNNHY